jgi:hypothetical protein
MLNREEALLNSIAESKDTTLEPRTRYEAFLASIANGEEITLEPKTRQEFLLKKISRNSGSSSGGSSGGDASQLNALIEGSITEVTSDATIVRNYAFSNCSNLTTVDFPLVTTIGNNSFYDCSNLTTVDFPKVTYIDNNSFGGCTNLTEVDFPKVTYIGSYAFGSCSNLTTVDFLLLNTIDSKGFYKCTNLTKVVIRRNSKLTTLKNANAFDQTPMTGGKGYIYVPRALVDSYKTATNWTTYANQFRALEDYTADGTITGELDESKI